MKTILIVFVAFFAPIATFAQKAKANEKAAGSTITVQSNYRCPMHTDVVSNGPGKCSKCDMDLTLSKKEQMKKDVVRDYRCPMHQEVLSDMAGTCAKCGKELMLVDRKGSKQAHTTYVCSMHPEVTADKAGKCPKCGMELTKAKSF